VVGLALSTMGVGSPLGAGLAPSGGYSVVPGKCLTQTVRLTLASEQISFCAPSSFPVSVVEDNISDPSVNYAGLDQKDGYGVINIKATLAGNTPGIGRPVYTSDGVIAYRQVVKTIEAARSDRIVSDGPLGIFWNETVPSMQLDVSLPTSSGRNNVRSIEWYFTHNNRLWSFIIAWDTGMQNAAEWEAASKNMNVQGSGVGNLTDTAINLGIASMQSKASARISSVGGPIDVAPPSWWKGACDDTNYYANTTPPTHSSVLSSWHGVSACGPVGGPDYQVHFYSGAWGEFEFECVELVMRFLYLEWGIAPFAGNGNTIKDNVPSSMVFYPNGTHALVPGDIITEDDPLSTTDSGHAMIITGVSLNVNGSGTISILEQKSISSGVRSLNVTNWTVTTDAWTSMSVQGWLHAKANTYVQKDGDLDVIFSTGTGPNDVVYSIALQTDNKILIAGNFTAYNGTSRNKVARLNSDGSLDATFNPPASIYGSVYKIALQSNGKVLVAGDRIVRLKSDGTLDTTFTCTADDIVRDLAIQSDGKIVVAGDFSTVNDISREGIARLNTNGSLDANFNPGSGTLGKNIASIALLGTGKILIGGNFTAYNGYSRNKVARLNSNGSLDLTFDPGTGIPGSSELVKTIMPQSDGRILLGGNFTAYNGTSRNKVARLMGDGSLDLFFDPGTGITGSTNYVKTIVPQPDGRILIGGDFSAYNGTLVNRLGRLNFNGSLDTTFTAGRDAGVESIALQPDAKILVGGLFTGNVVRLLNHFEPCYTLNMAVNPSAAGTVSSNLAPNCPAVGFINGTAIQLTSTPNPSFIFANWSGDAAGSSNPLTVTLNTNKSVTANFNAAPLPAAFEKSLPGDGSTKLPANLDLIWNASSTASSYEYCLDTTDDSSCDGDFWIPNGLSTVVSLSNLLPSTVYYWQVRARNNSGITLADSGAWWSFYRDGIPAVPVTIAPNGTTFIDYPPPYIWNESKGAASYHLEVVDLIDLSTKLIDIIIDGSACSGGVCIYHSAVLLPVGQYEFRVSALKDAVESDFSAWRPFTVVVGVKIFLPLVPSL
jgi:uncharacterized delta-60 repeat protein